MGSMKRGESLLFSAFSSCVTLLLLFTLLLLAQHNAHAFVPEYMLGTPSVTRVTDTSMHLNVRLNTQGRFDFVVVARGVTAPSVKQLKAGTDGDDVPAIIAGGQQVTTTTLTFKEIIFQKLNLSTSYDVYVVSEDAFTPPAVGPIMLVQFTTLDGRKWFGVGTGDNSDNRLGLGGVRDHWTPHAVPGWDNVTVNTEAQYPSLTMPWGQELHFGDIWNGRMTWSTQNEHYVPNKKKAFLSAGGNHWVGVLAKDQKSYVYTFGKNDNGRLGLNDTVQHLTATSVQPDVFTQVHQAQAGLEFSTFTNAKKLYTFGRNNFGQLGLGDTQDRLTPTLVEGYSDVDYLSAGRDHVLFVNGGQLFSFGSNRFGQLGVGDTVDRHTPVAVPGFSNVDIVSAGNYYSLFVQDRQVYSFGYNFQTGGNFQGYSPHNIKCYEQHSAGCFDTGRPSPNLDNPDQPFNP